MTPEVSIIIPNWNGIRWLANCLDSINRSSARIFEVIVVDNGSHDGSRELIERNYPEVRVIGLSRNFGFARACNQGIRAARASLVCLLNNDIEVTPEWIGELRDGMDRYPECGMATSRMHFLDEPGVLYNTGDSFKAWGAGGARGLGERDVGQYDEEEYVFGACAGAGIYRRSLFEAVGLLDEDFFIFSEDVDINLRAQFQGARCIYLPKAKVYHIGTATVGFHSDKHVFLFMRNDLFVLLKNMNLAHFLSHFPLILRKRISMIWQTAKAGQGRIGFLAYLSFFQMFCRMVQKRRRLRQEHDLSFNGFKQHIGWK